VLTSFWNEESGAISVDWTVLTGGLVGLGLATVAIVANGIGSISEDVSGSVSGVLADGVEALVYFGDFAEGAAGWVNGIVTDGSEFGAVLGPYGGTGGAVGVESTFDIPPGTETASFTFDMLAIDSWDNEEFIVFVDGEPAASLQFQFGTDGVTGEWVSSNPDYGFQVLDVGPRGHSGYNTGWSDQGATVQLDVANPGDSVTLGFGSTLDQSREDESFAVDNVRLIAN
jgi:hypothetical protein